MDPKDKFHSRLYLQHNEARFNHFRSLGLPIQGRSVLELGAGIGDHTEFLLSLGAGEIFCVEARDENIIILEDRFSSHDIVSIFKMDLEHPSPLRRTFDIIYSYGLLYHLSNPEELLRWMGEHVHGYLILETCVSVSKENINRYVDEDCANVTQSFSGKGCRPSRKWIMKNLENLFPYQYIPVTQPEHPEFPVDWNNISATSRLTRSIFIGSHINFNENEMLSNNLFDHYNQNSINK